MLFGWTSPLLQSIIDTLENPHPPARRPVHRPKLLQLSQILKLRVNKIEIPSTTEYTITLKCNINGTTFD